LRILVDPQKTLVDGPGEVVYSWSPCRFRPLFEETLMTEKPDRSTPAVWARFRFSVVGSLLSSPPARGALKAAIRSLATKTWTHPVSGREVRFAAVTIERWYYTAHREKDDPVGVLRRAVRYYCRQCHSQGNQLELWAAATNLPLHQATIDLCRVLGQEAPRLRRW
jgi:hypothetical protein